MEYSHPNMDASMMGLNEEENYHTQMEILPLNQKEYEQTPLHISTLPEEVIPEMKPLNE